MATLIGDTLMSSSLPSRLVLKGGPRFSSRIGQHRGQELAFGIEKHFGALLFNLAKRFVRVKSLRVLESHMLLELLDFVHILPQIIKR